ncbi:hypothetical protein [Antribacter gilvus]|uniref:hypothetical protein n=1 Tax=Antribacter gilvus TaxID=2304675 RepID=UPI000F77288B|nr:hypothetical protein [Antribacter gilvus]
MTAGGDQHRRRAATWWRRNRVWLVLVPVAVVAGLGASSYRLQDFWWEADLRHRLAHAAPGDPARYTDSYEDPFTFETVTTDFRVRLEGLSPATLVPRWNDDPLPVPEGSDGYRVTLAFERAGESNLYGCQVILVDTDGNRYGDGDPFRQMPQCHPAGDDGSVELETPRTPWSAAPVVVTAAGAEITQVWVTMDGSNRYVSLEVP